ncbi:hypothetical protein H4R34_000632 [Dimargaris verticillata]|uniref:Pro-apoptotic serine protease NMA111 n=1 Tax=Dimargaris verticillata TaxID=2761393 RepID=A0A9W8BBH2_9FUNG|nr:hypothetical protein H4R34_000632 [Dimargaris verticillata]
MTDSSTSQPPPSGSPAHPDHRRGAATPPVTRQDASHATTVTPLAHTSRRAPLNLLSGEHDSAVSQNKQAARWSPPSQAEQPVLVPRLRSKSLVETTASSLRSHHPLPAAEGGSGGGGTHGSIQSPGPGIRARRSKSITESIITHRRPSAPSDVLAYVYLPAHFTTPTVTEYPSGPFLPEQSGKKALPEDGALIESPASEATADHEPLPVTWEPTLERAIKAIVSIKANCVRSFDTESSGAYTATGFVVDAKRGIILSNRHVVSPAPTVAQAIFSNYEEVPLEPIYRDPVHDFGFFRFDPSKVRFMELDAIPLSPHRAKIGLEIRVVGNDAGEKLSILAGTLARLDRRAPEYGVGNYNDFNTFYLQAASGTSGGSSGSPVLDIQGHAVALNAGGSTRASSSFYLPLDRIVRALNYIQMEQSVPRGTLQAEFEYQSYDELRRLGLDPQIEQSMRQRFPAETGMLVVRSVLPQGPADQKLRPGDIVVAVNDEPLTQFSSLFSIIDDAVGKNISLTICRGPQPYVIDLTIQDLHSVTPNRFVEIGGGVVNEVSYQLARGYGLPVGGVYVATSGHMLGSGSAWRGSVVVALNNIPTPTLDEFIHAVQQLPDGSRVPIRFFPITKFHKEQVSIIHVDRHWHPFKLAVRNDQTGLWDYKEFPPPPPIPANTPFTTTLLQVDPKLTPAHRVWPCFVSIDFYIPYLVDGAQATMHYGPGLIIDRERGLVVCDRDTVPISIGDIYITFGNSLIIPGQLLLLHPVYNFAILCYNPALIGDTPVESARLAPPEVTGKLSPGDPINLVALTTDQEPLVKKTKITNIGPVVTRECTPPRWRSVNVEGIRVDDSVTSQGGVLCDDDGMILGLWSNYTSQNSSGKDFSFMVGLKVDPILKALEHMLRTMDRITQADQIKQDPGLLDSCSATESITSETCLLKTQILRTPVLPSLRTLDVEFSFMTMVSARTLGLSEERVRQLQQASVHDTPTVVYVLNLLSPLSPAADQLRIGDAILEVNGELVLKPYSLAVFYDQELVTLTVLRAGEELTLTIPTIPLPTMETRRIVGWAGALIQTPYHAVHEQVKSIPSDLYISCILYGSPANAYNLRPGVWITEINNEPVHNMDDFLEKLRHFRQFYQEKLAAAQQQAADDGRDGNEETSSPLDLAPSSPAAEPKDRRFGAEDYFIRLTTINRAGISRILSLRVDDHYWPTWDLVQSPHSVSGWACNFDVL